jgi:lactoylglutathione lyase
MISSKSVGIYFLHKEERMRLRHVGIWTQDLEEALMYYVTYFRCSHGEKYVNPSSGFESYFLFFDDSSSIELMKAGNVRIPGANSDEERLGLSHLAISLGSKEAVTDLANTLKADGYKIVKGPHMTGDGYFEAVTLDPEGNRIELTE